MPAHGPVTRATVTITRQAASALVEAARQAGDSLGFEPATAVVDLGGHLVPSNAMLAAPYLAASIAIDKAWTAASYQVSTSYWNDYVRNPAVAPLHTCLV